LLYDKNLMFFNRIIGYKKNIVCKDIMMIEGVLPKKNNNGDFPVFPISYKTVKLTDKAD
jgi:hypothetical protein